MLDKGFSEIQISEILILNEETVFGWSKKFSESKTIGEFMNFKYVRYTGRLYEKQIMIVKQYIADNM